MTLSYRYKEDIMNVASSTAEFTENDDTPTRLKGEERVSPRRVTVIGSPSRCDVLCDVFQVREGTRETGSCS